MLNDAKSWWNTLSTPWKRAFNEVALRQQDSDAILPDDMLELVYTSANHRFAGPTAPYPNMSFELADMSGLVGLPNAEVVVMTHHHLRHIEEVATMPQLRSLFVYSNQITSLAGIEQVPLLVELYVHNNALTSLQPLSNLTHLKSVYCSQNLLSDLEGIGPQHLDTLEQFFCLPNPNLLKSTVLAFEQKVGIKCSKS